MARLLEVVFMRRGLTLVLAVGVGFSVRAQGSDLGFPSFSEYPVSAIFKGKPVAPRLVQPGDRLFRSRILEGAAAGPNFAGHFSIAEWGCGTACVSIAIVDAETGRVYPGLFVILGYGRARKYADVDEGRYAPLSYVLSSRLLIARGCPEDENCASYFYEWSRSRFKMLRKVPGEAIRR